MPKSLRDYRREKGAFLKDVADAIGTSVSSVSGWEKGDVEPAAPMIPKLAAFFGITPEEARLAVEQSASEKHATAK